MNWLTRIRQLLCSHDWVYMDDGIVDISEGIMYMEGMMIEYNPIKYHLVKYCCRKCNKTVDHGFYIV